jgi:serine/threonine-protein kinase
LLGWSAPEVTAGAPSAAGDRYSLALLCFFAVTGMPWYTALRGAESLESGRGSRNASERARGFGGELDPAFDAWFERALAEDPHARFSSALEMAEGFRQVLSGSLAPIPPSTVHPFAATRPVPLAEQPTVPVKQVSARAPSTPPQATLPASSPARAGSDPTALGSPPRQPEFERTIPLSASPSAPPPPREPSMPPPSSVERPARGAFPVKLLAALAAASVAFGVWWWLR